ncbi:MAG: glycine betaine ABC transporter substrate-binding protein [Kurthia sp.]|nr:glycine betaine ABC transporter substrate-binding protein [Candidatus Kurthia equi]
MIKLTRKNTLKMMGALVGTLLLTACGSSGETSDSKEQKNIELAYVEWDTEIASTHVIGQVLKDEGYKVKLTGLDNSIMWEAVANDKADGMVAGWLPTSHKSQYEKNKEDLVDLGVNLEGGHSGLVVPKYMKADSIEDLSDEANKKITGIEPGAGIMTLTQNAIDTYENLGDWKLKSSSSGAMTVALSQAIKKKEDIVITGWSPHWIFIKYDLKYLKDPKKIYGSEEQIHTFVSKKLKDKSQGAYDILDKFAWSTEDMESVMLDISEGTSPEDAAKKWVDANKNKVAEWTK